MESKEITFILSYYNQPRETLIRHLDNWKQFKNKDRFSFIIVDDCSKISASELLKDYNSENLDISLYRVEEDLYCNIAGVRNLGAKECKTPYMVILDMDTIVNDVMSDELLNLVKLNKNTNNVFKFIRKVPSDRFHIKNNQPHPAVCLIRKEDYWNIGGCEEDLVGHYGQTDPCFWHRAKNKVRVNVCRHIQLLYYPDAEADINRDTTHNTHLFEVKKRTDEWSTDFIRFKWNKSI